MNLLSPTTAQTKVSSQEGLVEKSLRFDLSLKTTEDTECPEFSYVELVKSKKNARTSSCNLDDDTKNKQEAEFLAQYFDKKYGTSGYAKQRRKDRVQDLTDVGYGYDENDPFVDNSQCYDELIPSSLTTQFGGFYINSGKLEFKQVSDDSISAEDEDSLPLSTHMRRTSQYIASDEDTNNSLTRKKVKKRKISVEREEKRRKLSLQGKDKLTLSTKKKPTKVQLLVAKAKKAQHINLTDKTNIAKKITSDSEWRQAIVNGARKKDSVMLVETSLCGPSMDKDGYHSSSSDEVSLAKLSVSTKESNKLPRSLPHNIKQQIFSLTKIAKSSEKEGKVKFFSSDVNHLLLGIEAGSQSLSNRERSEIYQHLTPHMPCSKDTLIRRMKKLHATKQHEKLRTPLSELKRAIDAVMVDQTKRYDEECAAQQLAKLDDRAPLLASTDDDDDGTSTLHSVEEKSKRTYAPRRKFQWNDNIRSLLYEVIKVKLQQYIENKSKLGAADEYLKNFLESEVKSLWPKGWMQGRALYKETRGVHGNVTGDGPKVKKAPPVSNRKAAPTKERKSGLSRLFTKETTMPLSFDGASPSKRAEMMNRAILSAQKDAAKQSRKSSLKQDSNKGNNKPSCSVKEEPSSKLHHPAVTKSKLVKTTNEKMCTGSIGDSAELDVSCMSGAAKLEVGIKNELEKLDNSQRKGLHSNATKRISCDDSANYFSSPLENNAVNSHSHNITQSLLKDLEKPIINPIPTVSNSTSNLDRTGVLQAASPSKSSFKPPPSSLPSSLENFNAELLKLALMSSPSGCTALPRFSLNSDVTMQPTLDDFTSFMKVQQITLQLPQNLSHSTSPTSTSNQIKLATSVSSTGKLSGKDKTMQPQAKKVIQKRSSCEISAQVANKSEPRIRSSHYPKAHHWPSYGDSLTNAYENTVTSSHHIDREKRQRISPPHQEDFLKHLPQHLQKWPPSDGEKMGPSSSRKQVFSQNEMISGIDQPFTQSDSKQWKMEMLKRPSLKSDSQKGSLPPNDHQMLPLEGDAQSESKQWKIEMLKRPSLNSDSQKGSLPPNDHQTLPLEGDARKQSFHSTSTSSSTFLHKGANTVITSQQVKDQSIFSRHRSTANPPHASSKSPLVSAHNRSSTSTSSESSFHPINLLSQDCALYPSSTGPYHSTYVSSNSSRLYTSTSSNSSRMFTTPSRFTSQEHRKSSYSGLPHDLGIADDDEAMD